MGVPPILAQIDLEKHDETVYDRIREEWFFEDAALNIGGGQTRTGGDRSRWIYSPLQLPLCDTPRRDWPHHRNSQLIPVLNIESGA